MIFIRKKIVQHQNFVLCGLKDTYKKRAYVSWQYSRDILLEWLNDSADCKNVQLRDVTRRLGCLWATPELLWRCYTLYQRRLRQRVFKFVGRRSLLPTAKTHIQTQWLPPRNNETVSAVWTPPCMIIIVITIIDICI